jgi:alpha-glucosidase
VGVAALLPMFRLEAGSGGGLSGEPWTFSPDVEQACREALERRSRLLPYIYTLALDAYRYGLPMMRPLMTAEPANPALRAVDDAFLLGGDLLLRVNSPAAGGDPPPTLAGWRKFDFGEESRLLPEMYIRPGAIIPIGPVMQHDGEKPLEPLTLLVHLNAEGQAMGPLFEDDGTSLNYLQSQCRVAYYQATREGDEVKVRMVRLDGAMGMAKRKLVVRVLLPEGKEATAEYWDALDTKVKLP